jgi:hypothetical protein
MPSSSPPDDPMEIGMTRVTKKCEKRVLEIRTSVYQAKGLGRVDQVLRG